MKKFSICLVLIFICTILFSVKALAIEEKKSIVVFPLNVSVNSSSYAIYAKAQDMFASDLVNSLHSFDDTNVVDINSAENILKNANLQKKYEKMIKQYKQRYIVDYDKLEEITKALGVNHVVFIYGGFDSEKSFLKSNWKYRCQWIWASPIKSSAQLNINTTLIDIKRRNYSLETNVKKDIPMDNFYQASNSFGENIVPISEIKKFTKPNAIKIAQKIHSELYPEKTEKYSQKDAFIDKFIPNNGTINDFKGENGFPSVDLNTQNQVNEQRKENYKKWMQEKL